MKKLCGALFLTAILILPGGRALADNVADIFLRLPAGECGGFTPVERQMMLNGTIAAPWSAGRSLSPDMEQPWVEILSTRYMVLHRPGYGDITYKVFDGPNFQLLTVCRGRQRTSTLDSGCRFNLCLYRLDRLGLTRVNHNEYLPSITILDFVTADILADKKAVEDVVRRAPTYSQCLICNASAQDASALDIVTVTTVNAAACDNFLPPFGLLPLTWDGLEFTKPYDRAAPKEEEATR